MSPTLLVVVLAAIGIAVFVYGVLLMAQRQEGGSARRPALLMFAGLALVVLGMLSALVLTWAQSPATAEPHVEIPGLGSPGAPPPASPLPTSPATAPAPAH